VPLPGGGGRLQQPVHVDDLAAAVVAALTAPGAVGQIYDVAGPEPLTLRQVVLDAGGAVGRRPRLLTVPLSPAVALARAYERMAPSPRLKAEQLQRLAEDKAFDIGPARRDLGYDPRPFASGIRQEAELLA
jgi:nucleoside-diphosphate-sugar epimerase